MTDYRFVPLDAQSTEALSATGLELRLVDTADEAALKRWFLAEIQGFHDSVPSDEVLARVMHDVGDDRITGVWDPAGADAESPVATVRSWPMALTVPGGATMQAWAISGVTVAPTHRRRGVARAMMSAELRTAREAGIAMAMLTVSEATIYRRFGFGPAAYQAHYSIDTSRAGWSGPATAGRVSLVDPKSLLPDAPALFERARIRFPGEVDRRPVLWERMFGLYPTTPGHEKSGVRAVRYDDESGELQGFAVYSFVNENDTYPGRLELADLVAATDAASSALWRYLVEMDLISEIRTSLRSVAEPAAWQLVDYRAVRKTEERDHLWLRILDLPAALAHRTYSSPGTFVLTVSDDLGFADGQYLLTVDADGTATTHPLAPGEGRPGGNVPAHAARLSLSIADLSAIYLGGTSAVTLARAGLVIEQTPGSAARLDTTFHSPDIPWLSIWF
ncbi:MAG TPA: GNAT family N-acetyltransferase [Glaciibacter sp.]|nr:GNAT family N-acetyltransferase [Glaciibacter sp.]